ncbi:hypothetical protein I4U23_006278 [Adineta vaga]|nr:hypothetical protein I4U23_006278 [Adineta vaga]
MIKVIFFLLLLFVTQSDEHLVRNHHHRPKSSRRYRISPSTGVRIALPTPEQLKWQAQELAVLVTFNMATYLNTDGCPDQYVADISLFNLYLLNTDNWVQTMVDLGAQYAVLVAKHGCGFLMAPSNVRFPLNPSGQIISYNYTVGYSPVKGRNILDEFIKSCGKRQIRTGFYYTVVVNNWLNVLDGFVQNRTLKPGQLNITQQTYDSVVLEQLRELWTEYGSLNEIWFDGGYTQSLKDPIRALLTELQPDAIAFNGYGVSHNPARWIGTEMGVAPDPNWSTGITEDGGDPDSPIFCPAECDTTLQNDDRWFWGVNTTLRPLSELIQVYHETVGRNCILMLDLTPDRTGLIPPEYASRYKELGDFIRSCYDRSVIQEDQTNGQVIREYTIDVQLANATDINEWITVAKGTNVGNKKIDVWSIGAQLVSGVRLNITKSVDKPVIKAFTVHLCN